MTNNEIHQDVSYTDLNVAITDNPSPPERAASFASITLSEERALRLFRTVHQQNRLIPLSNIERLAVDVQDVQSKRSSNTSQQPVLNTNASWLSMSESSNICRICRYKRTDTALIECPCKCTGTMGHVHEKCLQRWMRIRKDDRCEICNEVFNCPHIKKNYGRLVTAFFQPQYFGACAKILLNFLTLTPLVCFTMNQMIAVIESIHDGNPTRVLIVGPSLLLATSAYFFFYFEWAMTCAFRLNNIIYHWWNFGDQDDDDYNVVNELDSEERFFDP